MPATAYVERLVDLLDPSANVILNMSVAEATQRVGSGDAAAVREIAGHFAVMHKQGTVVRMARSIGRPMRYFLAKRAEGPALFIADRMDTLRDALAAEGLAGQFHPSYTRMVPAHYVVEIQLVGCPDPDPVYTRFFTPKRASLPTDLDEIGARYIGALQIEVAKWLRHVEQVSDGQAPIGVCFSGGIDSGSVFLVVYDTMKRLGMSPARLKAFVLDAGGPDVAQAHAFLDQLGLGLFFEGIPAGSTPLDIEETLRVLEDYKPLDVECAALGLRRNVSRVWTVLDVPATSWFQLRMKGAEE